MGVFRTMDVTKKGSITLDQYKEAIRLLGARSFNETPKGHEQNEISLDTFLDES